MTSSGPPSAPTSGRSRAQAAGLFGLVFAVYAATASDAVRLDDSAFFLLTCEQPGIAHPPGYPLYTLLCNAWLRVWPLGTLPFRLALFSAFCGAAASVVVGALALRLTRGDRLAAGVAALAFAFSRVHWYTSTTHEVYALGEWLFFGALACVLRATETGSRRALYAAALLLGLAASNHLPLVLLSSVGVLVVSWPVRAAAVREAPGLIAAFGLGLLPYAYLVLRTAPDLYAFLGPIEGGEDFFAYVARSVYEWPGGSGGTFWDRLQLQGALAREIATQLTPLGAALAALGVWRLSVEGPRSLAWGLLVIFVANTVVLWGLHDEYADLALATLRVFPGIAYGVMALFLACGFAWLRARYLADRSGLARVIATGFVLALLAWNGPANDFRANRFADGYARAILEALPPDAVLFEGADFASSSLEYVHERDGVRSDVTLYNVQGVMLPNRLYAHDLPVPERDAFLRRWIALQSRPVYYASVIEPPYGFEDLGLLRRVRVDLPPGSATYALPDSVRRWLEEALEAGSNDPLERLVLARARQFVGRAVTALVEIEGRSEPEWVALHARLAGDYYAELGALEAHTREAAQVGPGDRERFFAHYRAALAAEPAAGLPGRSERSMLRYMAAYFHYRDGAPERARPLAEEAVALWPRNSGARELLRALSKSTVGTPAASGGPG